MKIDQILSVLENPVIHGNLPDSVNGITSDSRKISKGGAFVAIKGLTHDGHDFVDQAEKAGAKLLITSKPVTTNLPYLQVSDALVAGVSLTLAWYDNPQKKMRIAGVTGTNGKTTVSTLVHQVLSELGYTAGLMGTISTKIGDEEQESRLTTGNHEQIAENLHRMSVAGCGFVAMEVSSHALDQRRVIGLDFDVAAFTNLSHDHLDYHGSTDAYIRSKKLLFDTLSEDAIAVINSDDPVSEIMIKDCKATVWRFGLKDESLRILNQTATGMSLEVDETFIYTPLSGIFNAYNVAAAYLICRAFGCSAQNTATALANATGARGRMERVGSDKFEPTIFVDYAHTPDALKNVLQTLQGIETTGQLVVVFGCGGDRDKTKRPEMGAIASEYADKVFVTSDNPRTEKPKLIISDIIGGVPKEHKAKVQKIIDRKEAIEEAILTAGEQDIILIAGKGHETYQEIDGVRYPMDDRAIATEMLAKRASSLNQTERIN